jgi:hypothetical protein
MSQPLANLDRDALLKESNPMGGLYRFIEVIDVDEVDVFPSVVDKVRIDQPITFLNGTGSHFWYHSKDTGSVNSEMVGQKGGEVFRNSIAFTVPTNAQELLEQVQSMLGKPLIVIGTDRQGMKRIVGSKLRPATLRARNTTGSSASNRPGTSFTIEAFSKYIALIYDVEGAYTVNSDGFNFNLITVEKEYTAL